MFEHPHELRELAAWYRDLTQVEPGVNRTWHMKLVDFLEKRATEIEDSQAARPAATPDYRYPQGIAGPAND